jgi:hypothetical protein
MERFAAYPTILHRIRPNEKSRFQWTTAQILDRIKFIWINGELNFDEKGVASGRMPRA